MISKNDCLILLTELNDLGVDASQEIKKLIALSEPSLEILDFINKNRQLDLTSFYEKIRKSYNNKRSILYKNIMKDLDENNVNDILTTLNSYALQVCLFSRDIENKQMFFRFSRLSEVYKCLYHYSQTYDLIPCIKLLRLIKCDIKTLETVYREKDKK